MTAATPAALVGSFLSGFALPWTVVALFNLAQRTTPDARQGQVFAAVTLALAQPIAHPLGAAAITQVDFRLVYLTTAVITLATGLSLSGCSDVEA